MAAPPEQPKWLLPRDLSEKAADAVIPDIAVDAQGDAVVVWAQSKVSSWTVQAVERAAGGSWESPQRLSAPASHVASPQVAMAGDSVVAVWERYNDKSKNLIVQEADREPATHKWSKPQSLSASGQDAQSPKVAVDAKGDAVVVWPSVSLRGWSVLAAYRPPGGAWQTRPLQPPGVATAAADVVIDDTGRAVAVWATNGGNGFRVVASTRRTDGSWSKPVVISGLDATGLIAPQLALEPNNNVTVVWSRSVSSGAVLESTTRNAVTGRWSPPVQLFPTGAEVVVPTLAIDRRGDGLLAWPNSDQSGLSLLASYRKPGKGWGTPVTLVSAETVTPQAALDGRGNGVVVWTRKINGLFRVQSASATGETMTWSTARTLSRRGADATTPQVALDPSGDGAAAWARYDGQSFVIQGEGYDGNGPNLMKLSIPGSGVVGKRLTFAVTPKDTWTTVRAVRWTFGDGGASNSRATGHVYTRPGTYLARVTATDSFGHVSSVRRVVTISAS